MTNFVTNAEALLRAEEITHAYRDRDALRMADLLVASHDHVDATLAAFALLLDQALSKADDLADVSADVRLRGLASWVLHILASEGDDA